MSLTFEINISGNTITQVDKQVSDIMIENSINSRCQEARINLRGEEYHPTIGAAVTIDINGDEQFSGYISRVQKDIKGVSTYKLQLIGKTNDLWRERITAKNTHAYTNKKTSYMISSLTHDFSDLTFPQVDTLGTTITGEMDFLDYSLGDAIEKINSFDDYSFYVNNDDELIYYNPTTTQSLNVTESMILDRKPFEYSDDEIFNEIFVKGNGVSGCASDNTSQGLYGKQYLKIDEPLIENVSDANTLANSYLDEYKDPVLQGSVTIDGDTSINLSQKFELSLTNLDINEDTKIVSYKHTIDKKGFRTTIEFGREAYEPAKEFGFLQKTNSNNQYGIYKAIADAETAEAAADGKIVSYWEDNSGDISDPHLGDLWFDTNDGNKVYRYNGTAWVNAQDEEIATAISAASTAQSTADGKVTTHYCAPWPSNVEIGDLWVNTSAGAGDDRMFRANVANANEWSEWDSWTDWRANYSDIAGSKPPIDATNNEIYYQSSTPVTGVTAGDIWIKTPDMVVYIYDTAWRQSSWSEIDSSDIANNSIATAHIQNTAITIDKIHNDAINASKIVDGSIVTAKLDDLAVTLSKIGNDEIDGTKIKDNSISTPHLTANCVTANEIAANSVGASEIIANSITAGEIAANTITASEIAANSINASELNSNCISAIHINTNAIESDHILAGAIGASEIAAHSITVDELDTLNFDTDSITIGDDATYPLKFGVYNNQAQFYPQTASTCDVGTSSRPFNTIHCNSITIHDSLIGEDAEDQDLGSNSVPFGTVWLKNLRIGNEPLGGGDLASSTRTFNTAYLNVIKPTTHNLYDIGTSTIAYKTINANRFARCSDQSNSSIGYPSYPFRRGYIQELYSSVHGGSMVGTSSYPYENMYCDDYHTTSPTDPTDINLKELKDFKFENKKLPGFVTDTYDKVDEEGNKTGETVKTLNLGNMIAYNFSICKEQQNEIEDLRDIILSLRNEVELLKVKNNDSNK